MRKPEWLLVGVSPNPVSIDGSVGSVEGPNEVRGPGSAEAASEVLVEGVVRVLSYSVEGDERHAVFVAWPEGENSRVVKEFGHIITRPEGSKWPLPIVFFVLRDEPRLLEVNLRDGVVRMIGREEAERRINEAEPMKGPFGIAEYGVFIRSEKPT